MMTSLAARVYSFLAFFATEKAFAFFALTLLIFIPIWSDAIVPKLTALPSNFSYQANILSIDDLYDAAAGEFSGERRSKTVFSYNVLRNDGDITTIGNIFDVRTETGQKIFAVGRIYGINRLTGAHVAGYGDHDRSGYLFAPKNLKEGQDFTYWHVNYDSPALMKFQDVENIAGLRVFRYASMLHADQTDSLTYLPGVPEQYGINLDIDLQTWIEPQTGRLIEYEDDSVAYYYDKVTGERTLPWNKFQNRYTEQSVAAEVIVAKQELLMLSLYRNWIPGALFVAALALLVAAYVRRYFPRI